MTYPDVTRAPRAFLASVSRFFVAGLCCIFLFGLLPAAHAEEAPAASYVSPAQAKSWLDEGRDVLWLDVREADEFQAGHIAGARNIVWTDIEALAAGLPTDRPIVLYCIHSAHRAPAAAKTLGSLGFRDAHVMEGGIVAWQVAGFPIQASDQTVQAKILPATERCKEAKPL